MSDGARAGMIKLGLVGEGNQGLPDLARGESLEAELAVAAI